MDFVDRVDEQRRLTRALGGDAPCFIVMWGRRRLGKSTLIQRVLRDEDVYFEADKSATPIQMKLLVTAINAFYPDFGGATYDSWESLLLNFNQVCHDRSTLVIDEFPRLVKNDPALPSVLQRLIDSKKLRFNLIICGSSQRMMQKLVLGKDEPLYGRADELINLPPIPLRYWKEALQLDPVRAVEEYSLWGGVSRYWVLREKYADMYESMCDMILSPNGVLHEEPSALFDDEVADIAPYLSIMTSLGNGDSRFGKVADTLGRKTSDLHTPMKNLIDMHYVRKDVPFGESEKNSKKTLYRISDPFMAFYYRFVVPNKSLLALGRVERVASLVETHLSEHVGAIWEHLCQVAVSGNTLFGRDWNMAHRWWGKVPVFEEGKKTPVGFEEIELDVVAKSISGKKLLVGECKWTKADFADRQLQKLKTKVAKTPFAKDYDITYVLFLKELPLAECDANIILPEQVIELQ